MAKDYVLKFDGKAYDANSQAKNFDNSVKSYTKAIQKMNEEVDELDRYDDFSSLRINPTQYEMPEGSEYGIKRTSVHRGGSVIYQHQSQAALEFLRDLRGFGLLADVVGSGKTFEACLVISELAVRNKLKSLLFVVPAQVKDDWIRVVEMCFGMGKGTLYQAGPVLDERKISVANINGFLVPRRPIIVSVDDFVKWDQSATKYLFDVIVVDEAHHLCEEEGKYAFAMKTLSQMIQVKKKAKSTYCLLLSATPHQGNIEKMFRLWYFVRCKGGVPNDFDEKADKDRSSIYLKEKSYYRDFVCKSTSTVMEFIETTKKEEVLNRYKAQFDKFYRAYAAEHDIEDPFEELSSGRQDNIVTLFLKTDSEIEDKIIVTVARAYHNRILRTIMVRQPNGGLIAKKKNIVNILFYKTHNQIPEKVTVDDFGRSLIVNVQDLNGSEAITFDHYQYSLDSYTKDFAGAYSQKEAYAELVRKILVKIDNVDDNPNSFFEKKNTLQYYYEQISLCPTGVVNKFVPISLEEDDIFEHKFDMASKLFEEHPHSRIIVFFDYALKRKERVVDLFIDKMKKSPYASRMIEGIVTRKEELIKKFEDNDDSILIVTDSSFTEGANLQTSNIIINFQVTPDPVAMDQRIGRIFRLGQKNDVTIYSLADMDKLEGFALEYFSRIGLLTSNSGDATIIAGSNSEKMVAIRCNTCGRVELVSTADFDLMKRKKRLRCDNADCIKRNQVDARQGIKSEISVNDFRCDKCGTAFVRDERVEGYLCIGTPAYGLEKGVMCNRPGKGDREYYCKKTCAMANCSKLREMNCGVVRAYLEDKNLSEAVCLEICRRCKNKASCNQECRPNKPITECIECRNHQCRPGPHVLRFDANWETRCPKCNDNKAILKKIEASTFATYIKSAWDFKQDGGASFCKNLLAEADKVSEIKKILEKDDYDKED